MVLPCMTYTGMCRWTGLVFQTLSGSPLPKYWFITPPPDYVIASLYKTHLVDKLMHSKAYRPNVELFHETNQIQRVKVAEHSFAGGQRLRVFSMRQTNLVTKKAMVHQWYTEDDNSKSTHEHFEIFGRIFTFIVFLIMRTLKWKLNRRIL